MFIRKRSRQLNDPNHLAYLNTENHIIGETQSIGGFSAYKQYES